MIHSLVVKAGPYAKPIILLLALGVALASQAAGVDLGLDPDEIWQLLGASVLVFLTPAPGYVRAKLSRGGA